MVELAHAQRTMRENLSNSSVLADDNGKTVHYWTEMLIWDRDISHNLLLFASLIFMVEMLRRNTILIKIERTKLGHTLKGNAQAPSGTWKTITHGEKLNRSV